MGLEVFIMKIFINDVAVKSNSGGVYTVLKGVYDYAKEDIYNDYVFLLGSNLFQRTDNIKIIVRPELQTNYLKRTLFDLGFENNLIYDENPDVYFSLQNTAKLHLKKIPQFTYLHQPLPFQKEKKFSFFKRNERKLAFYQYIVGFIIKVSIKRSNTKVIVQSRWLKQILNDKNIALSKNVLVSVPKVDDSLNISYYPQNSDDQISFFYPSTAMLYKNHILVAEAIKYLTDDVRSKIKILFTLTESEFKNLTGINIIPKEIILLGRVSKDEVQDLLKKSILLFPSFIETYGLPILEAKQLGRPMLVSNVEVLQESVGPYDQVRYFNPFSVKELVSVINDTVNSRQLIQDTFTNEKVSTTHNLDNLLELIKVEVNDEPEN